jgi:hypothetical protein
MTLPVKAIVKHIPYGMWMPWTEVSQKIDYNATKSGVGKGEFKVAAEFNTTVQGQNCSYDLPPNCIKGYSKGIEIKELYNGTFRLGVKSNSGYISFMQNMLTIFNQIEYIFTNFDLNDDRYIKIKNIHSDIFIEESRGKNLIQNFLDAEVSASKVKNADKLLKSIKRLLNTASNMPRIHEIYEPLSGNKININSNTALCVLHDLGYSNEQIKTFLQTKYYNDALLHTCKINFESITEQMNIIIKHALDHVELLVVDEKKGYKLIDKNNVHFCRITSGGPRCEVKE